MYTDYRDLYKHNAIKWCHRLPQTRRLGAFSPLEGYDMHETVLIPYNAVQRHAESLPSSMSQCAYRYCTASPMEGPDGPASQDHTPVRIYQNCLITDVNMTSFRLHLMTRKPLWHLSRPIFQRMCAIYIHCMNIHVYVVGSLSNCQYRQKSITPGWFQTKRDGTGLQKRVAKHALQYIGVFTEQCTLNAGVNKAQYLRMLPNHSECTSSLKHVFWEFCRKPCQHATRGCDKCWMTCIHAGVSRSPREHASVPPDKRHCRQWMSSLFCGFLPNPFIHDLFCWSSRHKFVKTDL